MNILSIDFDWIMEPSIGIYNDFCCDEKALNSHIPVKDSIRFKPKYEKFYQLNYYLKKIKETIDDPTHIVFADYHNEIVKYIYEIWNIKEPYNLYNIDHHHDMGYDKQFKDELNSSNWVHFCKNLKVYNWIGNKTSDQSTLTPNIISNIPKFNSSTNIHSIKDIKFDYVFICLSPGWIPDELFYLFYVIKLYIGE